MARRAWGPESGSRSRGAVELHAGAHARSSGTSKLLQLEPPRGSRAVLGLGFGISDPLAVEQFDDAGIEVRVVPDGAIAASTFHPKFSLVERREDRRGLTRLQASTGQRRAAPGYLGITNDNWWQLQLHPRDQTDRALFWRRNTRGFRVLATGGVFLHLVKDPSAPEQLRAIRGFSSYSGDYEVGFAAELFRHYGRLLGVGDLHELDRPVTLDELRANGIPFARNIVSGRSLSLAEVATVLDLGGRVFADEVLLAAEHRTAPWH